MSEQVVPALLELSGAVCAFGQSVVVDRVDLRIISGEHVALTGTNGSGKTTLLRAVLGLHPLIGGRITLDNREARTAAEWKERRRRIAWIPQRQATGAFPLLVRELLASSFDAAAAHRAAAELSVTTLLDRPLHALSGGQLQRVFLARALGSVAGGAGIILADEPTAALDFAGQATVADLLRQVAATVLVVTHDRAMVQRSDRVFEMAGGGIREVTA